MCWNVWQFFYTYVTKSSGLSLQGILSYIIKGHMFFCEVCNNISYIQKCIFLIDFFLCWMSEMRGKSVADLGGGGATSTCPPQVHLSIENPRPSWARKQAGYVSNSQLPKLVPLGKILDPPLTLIIWTSVGLDALMKTTGTSAGHIFSCSSGDLQQ